MTTFNTHSKDLSHPQTNGHASANGHVNGHDEELNKDNKSTTLPATHLLANFASTTKPTALSPALREKVKEVLLDFIGVTVGAIKHADSTEPIIKAITALQGSSINESTPGVCTVLGLGTPHFLPQYAALLNAALAHSLDFDDTYAAGTLHAGVTAIPAALACFESLASAGEERSTDDLFLAISIGYETTCRLGRELGYAAYSRGFHNTSTAGIFGAISCISSLRRLPTNVVEHAFGLAGSKAAGSMQYLSNGSWNKRLHPGFAVHDAFACVALAEAGVIGAAQSIEGKSGFLQAYTPSQEVSLDRLVSGLGEEWCWLASSLKPYPACRMTHGFIELSGQLHDAKVSSSKMVPQVLDPEGIWRIELTMSPANFILVGDPTANKIHPTNVIDAQFSAYFQVACSLLNGAKTGDMSPYTRLADPAMHAVSEKIHVSIDKSMTGFAARMSVKWSSGEVDKVEQQFPLGELEHPFTKDGVHEKFMSLAESVYGQEKAEQIILKVGKLDGGGGNVMSLIGLLR